MIYPSKDEFEKLAKRGNLIPVYREVLADMETPVSTFRKIEEGSDYSFLLESVERGEKIGRYSFLGSDPKILLKGKGKEVDLIVEGDEDIFTSADETPLEVLRKIMKHYKPVVNEDLPPFIGGAVGYISYDAVRYFQSIPNKNNDDLHIPDVFFMITDSIVLFDHVKHKMLIVANAYTGNSPEKSYEEAIHKIDIIYAKLKYFNALRHEPEESDEEEIKSDPHRNTPESIQSNFTCEAFEQAVDRCKEYILAGDAFQIVLSQRLERTIQCDPFDIYRSLRTINPSPYMFYLKFGNLRLIGSSPEILVRLDGDKVNVRPIAGTRPRGKTTQEDMQLEKDLLADPKERAEHIMLVDLGRNDVGRVSKFGTVQVDDLMSIERYSHVMHIVSNVIGEINQGMDAFDVLAACFPAGTVSGAPKVRAMEIIDEFENIRRGPYAGSVGYFSFHGNLDSCITIRTIIVKDDKAYVQSGAGIVADSIPHQEYQETLNKAKGMIKAIEMAENGLD